MKAGSQQHSHFKSGYRSLTGALLEFLFHIRKGSPPGSARPSVRVAFWNKHVEALTDCEKEDCSCQLEDEPHA